MRRPDPSEYAPFYASYVAQVPGEDVVSALREGISATRELLRDVPDAEALRLHPPYTWTTKDVMAHLIDAERIFGARALRFARGDATPLPGFDEGQYAKETGANARPLADLVEEFSVLRQSHVFFFAGLPEAAWDRRGVAFEKSVSVRALAFIMAGHERHHVGILRRRLAGG